jgi:protein NEDD1
MTPIPIGKKTALAFRTPEENRWMEAGKGHGKGKGKTVVFKDGNDENVAEDEHEEEENQRARERSLSMQISPRRPSSAGPGSSSNSWAPSPLRGSPGAGSSSAHELLRTIVQDVMFDFQQEQRKEMVGLHLDLVRMGRGWKQELRELWTSDLKELRDENKRLRDENELLRRGY